MMNGKLFRAPVVKKAEDLLPSTEGQSNIASDGLTSSEVRNGPVFPNDLVLYTDEHRNMVVSTVYDHTLIRPLPLFHLIIALQSGDENETAVLPITLHQGRSPNGPIYGYVEAVERNTTATILNHIYNPSAQFRTTHVDIGAHITKQFCTFSYAVPNPTDPSVSDKQSFVWKQCTHHPAVLALAGDRPVEGHDWCMLDRKNERGMCLFRERPGDVAAREMKSKFMGMGKIIQDEREVLAVFVSAKIHSKMNPVKIAGRVRWCEGLSEGSELSEEAKLAAFLALIAFVEKIRRIGPMGGGF